MSEPTSNALRPLMLREHAHAQARLSDEAAGRIHAVLAARAEARSPLGCRSRVLAAALLLTGLMPWSSVQCQTPPVVAGCHGVAAR